MIKELLEMGFRHPAGFDVSMEQWGILKGDLFDSVEIKQINNHKHLKRLHVAGIENYSLWVSGKMVSVAKIIKKAFNSVVYSNLLIVLTDPELNQRGYATELIWELHLFLRQSILIGGAISPKGEKMIMALVQKYHNMHSNNPPLLNIDSGEILSFDERLLFSKSKIGLVLEDGHIDEAFKEICTGHKIWLNSSVDFSGCF